MVTPKSARPERLATEAPGTSKNAERVAANSGEFQPIVVRAPEAALLLNVSLRTVQKMHSTGAMPRALRLGRCCVWSVEELRAWIRAGCPSRSRWESEKGGRS